MIDFDDVEVLSFDCYGTLVDWETGILRALRPLLDRHGAAIEDAAALEMYARFEAQAQAGPYAPYREVLRRVVHRFAAELSLPLEAGESELLADSLPRWPVFSDTKEALRFLRERFRLMILSNVDDDLFGGTLPTLGVDFDRVVTAERARSYKPSPRHFEIARESEVSEKSWVHVAQSLYHDVAPARALGLTTVWVNRRRDREGPGATPAAAAVPDLEVASLAELVARLGSARP